MGEAVREFHRTFGMPAPEVPAWVDERLTLRLDLIAEENKEFAEAVEEGDLAHAVKESLDVIYVHLGFLIEMGVDPDLAFDEVHRSNMSKVWEDGTVKYREDGKVLKPPTFSPADIKKILNL